MLISVCIPSVRADTVGATVASLIRQTHAEWEAIVVGQGEDRSVREAVMAAASGDHRVRYVHSERTGSCVARNRGARDAAGEAVAFLDDDCEAAPDWLEQVVGRLERDPGLGLVAGALVRPAAPPRAGRFKVCPEMIPSEIIYDPAESAEAPPGFGAAGANLTVRRSTLERVGPFDEGLGPGTRFRSTEDTDYIIRAEAAGTVLCSTPAAVVHHTNGYRFGVGAAYRLLRDYAVGNGALAAKLTLSGDPRGGRWLRIELRSAVLGPFADRRPQALPRRLARLAFYFRGYVWCRWRCRVDGSDLAAAVLIDR